MHHINQPFLAEQSVHHCEHRVESPFEHRVSGFRFVPAIEIFVWSEKRTHLIVHSIADDNECVIAEQFGYVATIAAGKLLIGILNSRILLDGVLKLQDNNRQTVDKDYTIRDAVMFSIDGKLVDELKDVLCSLSLLIRLELIIIDEIDI